MIIFRPHRMNLTVAEAMQDAKEFQTVDDMKEYIVQLWNNSFGVYSELFTADDIVIDEKSAKNDSRIGWEDSMYVCVKRMGDTDYMKKYGHSQCIGMCATKYPRKNQSNQS